MPSTFRPPDIPAGTVLSDAERLNRLRLIRSHRVGPSTFGRLMDEHQTAAAALAALPDMAHAAGVSDYLPATYDAAAREIDAGRKAGARLVCLGEHAYPPGLAETADPPPVLWLRGRAALARDRAVAMVGARNASSLGTRMARLLGRELAKEGFVIVSGLARGIDAAAHAVALETGTIAVLAGGVDSVYPRENQALYDSIAQSGLVVSERPVGYHPQARDFPRRNRLIAGLGEAVVVVEAAARSGSLITARDALDLGRDVLAVPGHPLDARAAGCNMLIRDGASLVRGARDVLEAIGGIATEAHDESPDVEATTPAPATAAHRRKPAIESALALSRRILLLMQAAPVAEDQLIRDLDAPAGDVASQLVELEIAGKVHRHGGGLVSRRS